MPKLELVLQKVSKEIITLKSSEENSYADRFTLSVSIASENLSKKFQHENCSCQLKTLNSYHRGWKIPIFQKIIFPQIYHWLYAISSEEFFLHGPPQLQQKTLQAPTEQHSQGCTNPPSSHWHFTSLKN